MAEFKFSCPQCGQHIQCDTSYSGMQIDCPICKQAIVVPQIPRAAMSSVPEKSHSLRNILVIAAVMVVLVGLAGGGWYGYSKIKMHIKRGRLPPGLVSLWSGEGNVNDSVGGNNGKLAGNVTYGKGQVGQAFVFDGGKDWVSVGNPASLQLQDFTITAWIKRANTSYVSDNNNNAMIFSHGFKGYGLFLTTSGNPELGRLGIEGTKPDKAIMDTDWHHLAVTKSGSAVVFYIDGMAYPAPAYEQIFEFSSGASIGGKNAGKWADTFAGLIDEVGIYNRPLSASEIQAIYTEQK
jgi:hypothetical protein